MSDAHSRLIYRDQPIDRVELKFRGSDKEKALRFSGRATSFGDMDMQGDTILPGAFRKTLDPEQRPYPVMMFKGHNPALPIGKWMGIEEKEDGLHVDGELTPGNSIAEDTAASLRHGAVWGLSIGYIVPPGGAATTQEGGRVIKELDLVEISVVSLPADVGARVLAMKSLIEEIGTLSSAEDLLRDAAGFTRQEAKTFVSKLRAMPPGQPNVPDDALLRDAVSDSLNGLLAMENIALFKLGSLR